jgi:ribosomal protein S18 acetylase RimI-like enzyme
VNATIVLMPMQDVEFAEYQESSIASFAKEQVAAQAWKEVDSLANARVGFGALLPRGLATPDNFLYAIHARGASETVGTLWFAAQRQGGRRVAYVYDVSIKPAHRRKGYATQAFEELERRVIALGFDDIALQVFAHNTNAQRWYRKLGFRAKRISLAKPLT